MNKRHPFLAPDWTEPISYIILGIFIVIPIFLITFSEGPLFFCGVAFAGVAGFWILKLFLKHILSVHITSPVTFSLWLILSLILGFIIYTCLTEGFHNFFGEETFKGIVALIVLIGFWLAMLNGSFEKIKPGRTPASSIFEKKQHEIDDLYEEGFEKKNFEVLETLVEFFNPDYETFFEKSPKQATEVLEAARHILYRLETEGPALIYTKEDLEENSPQELEKYYHEMIHEAHERVMKMIKNRFACPQDSKQILDYFLKTQEFFEQLLKETNSNEIKQYKKSLEYIQKEIEKLQN